MSSKNKEGYLRGVDYGDPVVRYRGGKIKRLAELFAGRKLDISNEFAADIFYLFYLPVPLLREDDPSGGEEYRVLRALKDSPNFPIVKSRTIMDSFISSIAASVFLSEVKLLEEVAGKSKVGSEQMNVNENTEVSRIVEKALTTVNIDIENVKKLKSIVEGLEPGSASQLSLDEDVAEVLKLARNIDVKRILEMLKGLKPWELSVEKKKRRFKHGEIAGYEYGRDLERI
ncbi:MAG: vWA domain-containing protein, partial [Desulfurococcus sp.]